MSHPLDRMSTLDAEFFFAEHGEVPLHIGSVAVFDGPAPTREDLMRLFEAKLPLVPRYRQVVRTAPFQLLRPVWTDDQEFSIRHHVRYTTVPAGKLSAWKAGTLSLEGGCPEKAGICGFRTSPGSPPYPPRPGRLAAAYPAMERADVDAEDPRCQAPFLRHQDGRPSPGESDH